jgi:predicted nucleotidyltransferase
MVYTITEITDRLTPVFEQNGVTKAILFGSYAKGTATEESDVDIVVALNPT